mmetsp:Transcript_3131/g.11356  ORF Transcript_3131/g.11356 Transcript_3131/m.11356 type:complete len:248 (+) Transcript_3131:303-1046(+)
MRERRPLLEALFVRGGENLGNVEPLWSGAAQDVKDGCFERPALETPALRHWDAEGWRERLLLLAPLLSGGAHRQHLEWARHPSAELPLFVKERGVEARGLFVGHLAPEIEKQLKRRSAPDTRARGAARPDAIWVWPPPPDRGSSAAPGAAAPAVGFILHHSRGLHLAAHLGRLQRREPVRILLRRHVADASAALVAEKETVPPQREARLARPAHTAVVALLHPPVREGNHLWPHRSRRCAACHPLPL